jgi:O-antigen ligase
MQGVGPAVAVAAIAMGCFVAWTLISVNWSGVAARAYPEYSRALLYGLALLFFGMLPFDLRRIRWMVYGLAAAIVAVCGAALVARLLPHVILDTASVGEPRLAYPLTYWNALGILACVGTVLCLHLACSIRDPWPVRVIAAPALPVLAVTLYLTLSRGAIWGAAAAVVLYALLARPRGLPGAAIAVLPPTLIALLAASPSSKVSEGYPYLTVGPGKHLAVAVVGCMVAAAVLRAAMLPLDGWLARLRLPRLDPRTVGAALAAGVLAVLLVAVAAGVPGQVETKYHEFTDRADVNPERGESRLFSARAEGRFDLWDVALDGYREDRLKGTGAGTYETTWNRLRPTAAKVENAHSLYLEVLSELGVVGLGLLLVVLLTILGGFAYRARGPDRALFAAMLVAGLVWAVHAGVDWDWQMPAVTVWLFALGGATLARSLKRRRRRSHVDLKMAALRGGGVAACLVLMLLPARLAFSDSHLNSAIEAVRRGDCAAARSEASDSISEVAQRPTPYAVIGYCDLLERRYRSAARKVRQALRHDPRNWELQYTLAIARAGAGLDPRPAARRAVALNPREPELQQMPAGLLNGRRAAWKRASQEAVALPPGLGDP